MRLIYSLAIIFFSVGASANNYIVTTNSWTTAYAKAAGAKNVHQIAPSAMLHPAEYEITFHDFAKIMAAKIIIYAGYEVMVNDLEKILDNKTDRFLKIETRYNYESIEKSVLAIAEKLNTVETAKNNLKEIKIALEKGRYKIKELGWNKRPALVHFFQQSFANEMGFTVIETFGPAPLESYDISKLVNIYAALIIDNKHIPIASPVIESKKVIKSVELLNFPGTENTESLIDVIQYNIEEIIRTLK